MDSKRSQIGTQDIDELWSLYIGAIEGADDETRQKIERAISEKLKECAVYIVEEDDEI